MEKVFISKLSCLSLTYFRYWQANVDVHMRGLELIKPGVRCWYVDQHAANPIGSSQIFLVLKFPSSDVAHELNEMVLSQGMLDLRSFGYGHRYKSKFKFNSFMI